MAASSSSFKDQHIFSERVEVAQKIRAKYPECIPVIVEKAPTSKLPDIDKKKFLVPQTITVGKFLAEIRCHMSQVSEDTAVFLFVKDFILTGGLSMQDIFEKYRDEDGFLYVTYSGESTFGAVCAEAA